MSESNFPRMASKPAEDFSPTFESVFYRWNWKPIRNCPGRFLLSSGISELTPAEIAGENLPFFEFETKTGADKAIVMEFNDNGGLISYQKSDNRFLHTLNDCEGFSRKLKQLGIELSE